MFTLEINGKEYKVRYGVNSFADTDLMDRTQWLIERMMGEKENPDENYTNLLREMVVCLRDLLFVGLKKLNPLDSVEDAGDLIDDYVEEHKDDDNVIMGLFEKIAEELMAQGFLGDLLKTASKDEPKEQVKKKK